MRVAVIGAGPAGFFAAGEVLKKLPEAEVWLFEKRIAPYGLVRFGVAPDHPVTRRVIKMFDHIATDPRFHYLGNVSVGEDISLDDLRATYHAVIVCTGAERPRRPDIPGASIRGVYDALDFSWWTNGGGGSFAGDDLADAGSVVVIGNGNVALDVVRMLVRPSIIWAGTDVDPNAEAVLTSHDVKTIHVLGRRGPEDASFTEAELEELLRLEGWGFTSNGGFPFGLEAVPASGERSVTFMFNTVADAITGDDRVSSVRVREAAGALRDLPADLVFFATGHAGIALPGLSFDDAAGIVPNEKGRVTGDEGLYVCGWIKRGSKGLIGHNRKDAMETAGSIVADRDALLSRDVEPRDWASEIAAAGKRVVNWPDWQKIAKIEMDRGAHAGRPRLNLTDEEMIGVLE